MKEGHALNLTEQLSEVEMLVAAAPVSDTCNFPSFAFKVACCPASPNAWDHYPGL